MRQTSHSHRGWTMIAAAPEAAGHLRRFAVAVALALFLGFSLAPSIRAGESDNIRIAKALSNAYAEVVEKVGPAVVGIETEKIISQGNAGPGGNGMEELFDKFFDRLPRDFFGPDSRWPRSGPDNNMPKPRRQGLGSGVIIDREGHILTNNHVVADADSIKVELARDKGKTYKAEIVGRDPNSDLAVIKLIDPPSDLPIARLGDSDAMHPGNIVIAIGSPLGFKQSVTQGVVSATGRNLNELAYERFIQTDASINPGNSGGPLVNLDGEVIGLNTMISTQGGSGSIGIGFAIPINQAKGVITQLIEKGSVTRGWMGIEMNVEDPEISRALGHDGTGVLIVNVVPDGPAAKAGVRKGDLIVSFDNIALKDNEHLRYLVADTTPGRNVPLTVLRDGERVSLTINIAAQPENLYARGTGGGSESAPNAGGSDAEEVSTSLGLTVRTLDSATRQKYNIPDKITAGVVVTGVDDGGEAAEKGIRPGTVISEMNRLPVNDLTSFRKILKDSAEKEKVILYVHYGPVARYIMLKAK